MKKITLVDINGCVLGMGYCSEDAEAYAALEELVSQVDRSGIRAELCLEDTRYMDMTELGNAMAQYQENADAMEALAMNGALMDM